jgi:methyl-accepting chemotaxis protein
MTTPDVPGGWFNLPWQVTQIYNAVKRLETLMTEQQADINSATAAITGLLTDISTQVADLATDLTSLQAELQAGGPVSTTALDSAVAQVQATQAALDSGVSAITGLATPPAPVTPPVSGS